jgi:hypothetical protein
MKRVICLSVCLLVITTMMAQTQQGIVKTRGRMVNGVLKPGVGLQGATVQVKNRSAVVSGANGKFSFSFKKLRNSQDKTINAVSSNMGKRKITSKWPAH